MSQYRGTAPRPDKAKAIGGVLLVHAGLAALIVGGLNVSLVQQSIERLTTFDIEAPKPPPPPPPPQKQSERAKDEEGAAGKKAVPAEVVAPKVKPLVPPKIAAAPVPSTGSAASAGAANAGTGTGAGGSGSGLGGGGTGADYSKFTPAQLVRNISRGDYRAIAGDRMPQGIAMVSLRVEPDGSADNCRVVRSSGDGIIDRNLCPLVTSRLRFRPARDDRGRPIPYQLQYVARWSL
jgi:periplasmic protein TonB